MNEVETSKRILANYKDSYQSISESRDINAIGKVDNIMQICKQFPHDKIIEIGCGEGAILHLLSKRNFGNKLFGIEISSSGVEITKKRGIENLMECEVFDGYKTNYSDQFFDLVILSHVMEHVEYPRLLLYEAMRIGKHVFIEVPLEDTIFMKKNFVFTPVGHINFFSIKTIRSLVQTCNLHIINSKLCNQTFASKRYSSGLKGILSYILKELVMFISPSLASTLFTYHYCILCTKYI